MYSITKVRKLSLTCEHLIRSINDPEHPLTLEQLNVVELPLVKVDDDNNYVKIQFTPTIPHCSMATLIGLAIRVQLLRSLPDRFKVKLWEIIFPHPCALIVIRIKFLLLVPLFIKLWSLIIIISHVIMFVSLRLTSPSHLGRMRQKMQVNLVHTFVVNTTRITTQ